MFYVSLFYSFYSLSTFLLCALVCACALSWWTNQSKVWIWSLDYGSSVSWFTCRWCHPLAVHSVLRQRETSLFSKFREARSSKLKRPFSILMQQDVRNKKLKRTPVVWGFHTTVTFFYIQKNLFCFSALSKLKWKTLASVIRLQTPTLTWWKAYNHRRCRNKKTTMTFSNMQNLRHNNFILRVSGAALKFSLPHKAVDSLSTNQQAAVCLAPPVLQPALPLFLVTQQKRTKNWDSAH